MCFAGESSTCSNLTPLQISVPCTSIPGGLTFRSNEHAYTWAKFVWLGLPDEADYLMTIHGPKRMMREAKTITWQCRDDSRLFRELCTMWHDVYAEQLLQDLAFTKAAQHNSFQKILTDNADKVFVEATPDRFWGCGLPTSEVSRLSETQLLDQMTGSNVFGKILGHVAHILSDHDTFENCAGARPQFQFYLDQASRGGSDRLSQFQWHDAPLHAYRQLLPSSIKDCTNNANSCPIM